MIKNRHLILSAILIGFLALILGWISSNLSSANGWISFLNVLFIMGVVLVLAWLSIRTEEPPTWLLTLTIVAAVLRLALGVFWFTALPEWACDLLFLTFALRRELLICYYTLRS